MFGFAPLGTEPFGYGLLRWNDVAVTIAAVAISSTTVVAFAPPSNRVAVAVASGRSASASAPDRVASTTASSRISTPS